MSRAAFNFSSIFSQCESVLIHEYHCEHPDKTYKDIAIWAKRTFGIRKKVYPIHIQKIIIQVEKCKRPKKIKKEKAGVEEIIDIIKGQNTSDETPKEFKKAFVKDLR